MPRLKTVSLLAALLGLCAAPAIAQECRSNFGGAYTFLDSGLKPPDSRPFSAIAKFDFNPAGTFSIDAVISISGVGVLSSAAVSTWRWTGPCDIRVEEGFVGHLNRDGRFSSFVALDDVAAVGIMTRDAAVPDHTAAQAIGSQNAFSETLFGRVFAGALADQFTGRAGALRAGATGFVATPLRLSQLATANDGVPLIAAERRLGGFVSGQLAFGDRTFAAFESGRPFTIGGGTLGLDYRITPTSTIGLAGSYSAGNFNVASGNTNARGAAVSLYGTTSAGPFYLDGFVGGGLTDYNVTRSLDFIGMGMTASGRPRGHFIAAGGNAGYSFGVPGERWGPVGELRFNNVAIGGYSETGTGTLPAQLRDRDTTSLQSGLGAEAGVDITTEFGILTPYARATWRHEFVNTTETAVANFLVAPDLPLKVAAARLGRDFVAVAGGIACRLAPGLVVSADYVGEVGRSNQTVHQISLAARLVF